MLFLFYLYSQNNDPMFLILNGIVLLGLLPSYYVVLKEKIYDVLGREIKTLVSEELIPGKYELRWDGTDNGGATVSSGVYFYRLATGSLTQSRKMLLMRGAGSGVQNFSFAVLHSIQCQTKV